MRRLILALLPVVLLIGCDTNERRITLLKCDQTPLDGNYRCPRISRKGSEISLLVNPTTQKVQVTVIEPNGDFFPGTWIYENCSVVDANNWKCTDRSTTGAGEFRMTMQTTRAMFRGHFYYTLTSSQPPEYYTSSVGGWRRWLVEAGLLSYQQAQEYE